MSYMKGFEKLVLEPNLLLPLSKRLGSRTDFPLAVPGCRVLWNTLCNYQGWKLQKNYYYDHCRILDENHVRRAWGTESDMISILETFANAQFENGKQENNETIVFCSHCGSKVPDGNFCKECGSSMKLIHHN